MSNNLLIDLVCGGFGKWFRKPQEEVPPRKSVTYWHPKEADGKVSWMPNDSVYNVALEHERVEINYWQQQLDNCVMGTEDYEAISRRLKALKRGEKENYVLAHIHKGARNLGKLRPGATYTGEIDTSETLWIEHQKMLHHFPKGNYTITGKPYPNDTPRTTEQTSKPYKGASY